MLINLSDQNSVANQFIAELRDKRIQQDRLRFRKNVERLGQVMAYEISKRLLYRENTIETPLGVAIHQLPLNNPVLITVLRAGLPYFQGFLDYFDQADCGFIGAYRKEGSDEIAINLEYLAAPTLENRVVILIDPMLATGKSFIRCLDALQRNGSPEHVHLAALVAAPEGIQFVRENARVPMTIWTCDVDENLNDQFYIVPGLGDAGDLCFGQKL